MKLTPQNMNRIRKLVDAMYRDRIVMHTFWTIVLTCAVIVTGVMITHLVSARYAVLPMEPTVPIAFGCAIEPFGFTPRWGAMKSDAELARNFCEISPTEFIQPPLYDIDTLQFPLADLNDEGVSADVQDMITSKLFYSTRHFGLYNLDSGEYVANTHPGIDFKMPKGTPVSAIAGGRVNRVMREDGGLGNAVIVEHILPRTQERIFSVYGHLDMILVQEGLIVKPGHIIGIVGDSGDARGSHLHLQIDRDRGLLRHQPYVPARDTPLEETAKWTVHPMEFIEQY
ncbi:hypothetical protein A2635_00900 [Candidatus Peribacteria bacterium RIFCSPHIGHO2_01_FULL_51_9]|nr:MAG: hypothetical protein A2635_00900 [Candidatus Peribacteria bacterium RIFCSPHIGHO2_01_FULL_51_9]